MENLTIKNILQKDIERKIKNLLIFSFNIKQKLKNMIKC